MAGNAANLAPTFDSEFDILDVSGRGQWTPNMPWATADGQNQDDQPEAGFYVNPNFAPLASATVSVDDGSNRYVAGSRSLDVTGRPDASDFVLRAGAGSLTVEDFDAGKGDTLLLNRSLQGSLKQASDGHGGVLLSVGAEMGTIDRINHGTLSQSSIQFI